MHYSFSEAISREHWPSTTCLFRCTTAPDDTRVVRVICSGIPLAGQSHRKGRSFSDFTLHRNSSPMTLDDFCDNVQPHAQTGDRSLAQIRGPIEPLKNLVALLSRDAEAMIVH